MREQTHELKTWPEYFSAVLSGAKPFEVRRDDRPFKVGDTLHLREFEPTSGYTGRDLKCRVSYVLRDYPELKSGYVVLGLESAEQTRLQDNGVGYHPDTGDDPMNTLAQAHRIDSEGVDEYLDTGDETNLSGAYHAGAQAIRSRCQHLEQALNKIASWDEGPTVHSTFDEPCSAQEARATLASLLPVQEEGAKP